MWGDDTFVTERSVDTLIKRLRRKIEDDAADPQLILTVWGTGYKFCRCLILSGTRASTGASRLASSRCSRAVLLAQGVVAPLAHGSRRRLVGANAGAAGDLGRGGPCRRRLTRNPELTLETVRPRRTSVISIGRSLVVMRDGRTMSNRPNSLPQGYVRSMQMRLRRGEPLNTADPRMVRATARAIEIEAVADRRPAFAPPDRDRPPDAWRGGRPERSDRGGPPEPGDGQGPRGSGPGGPARGSASAPITVAGTDAGYVVIPINAAARVRRASRARPDVDVGRPGPAGDWRGERGAA